MRGKFKNSFSNVIPWQQKFLQRMRCFLKISLYARTASQKYALILGKLLREKFNAENAGGKNLGRLGRSNFFIIKIVT